MKKLTLPRPAALALGLSLTLGVGSLGLNYSPAPAEIVPPSPLAVMLDESTEGSSPERRVAQREHWSLLQAELEPLRASATAALEASNALLALPASDPALAAQLSSARDALSITISEHDPSALGDALLTLTNAQSALEASNAAAEAARAAAAEAERIAAEAAALRAQAAELERQQAEKASTPAPAPTKKSPSPPRAAPAPSASSDDIFQSILQGVGASGVSVSSDWSACQQADLGAGYIQGCARTDNTSTVFMKPIDAEMAASSAAKGVLLHEYSHLLQYRLGYAAMAAAADAVYGPGRGVEESADCMALVLGAGSRAGGYTSDCSGARGALANAFLAGRLG